MVYFKTILNFYRQNVFIIFVYYNNQIKTKCFKYKSINQYVTKLAMNFWQSKADFALCDSLYHAHLWQLFDAKIRTITRL